MVFIMDATLLDTRQLRTFLVLARVHSFTKAGKLLNITQSAISHSLRMLESDLGCALFLRHGRQVQLTAHGRELLHHAETIQRQMNQARASLGALDRNPRGHLRIGCTPSATQFLLPTVVREFKDSFPQHTLAVTPGETPDLIVRLETGELDFAVSLKPRDASRLTCHDLFEDDLLLLVSPRHAWCQQPPRPRELPAETFIISSRHSLTFRMIGEYFLKLGQHPTSFLELGNIEAIKEMAKQGLGAAIIAPWTSRAELTSGELVALPLPRARLRRRWVVAHLKDRPVSLAEHTFMGLCQDVGFALGQL